MSQIKRKPNTEENKNFPKTNFNLYFITAAVNIASFSAGVSVGWLSSAIPRLNGVIDSENNPLSSPLTTVEQSWIGSLAPLSACIGPILYGYASDKIGRKLTILLTILPITLAFIIKIFANQVLYLFISRILIGLSTGGSFTVIPMYIGEIAENKNRGALGCFMPVLFAAGILSAYSIGPYLPIKWFSLACALPSIAFVALVVLFAPESPHYLVMKNCEDMALRSLKKLRNGSEALIKKELKEVKHFVEESFLNKVSITDAFKSVGIRKAFFIDVMLMVIQQGTGITVVLTYMQSIFEASGSDLPSEISAIIIGVLQALASIATPFVIDRLGRRILLIVSAIGCTIAQIQLGVYFYLYTNDFDTSSISWLPISGLIMYMVIFNIGLGPLPWVIMSELFPANVKALASMIVTISASFLSFATAFAFPLLVTYIGLSQSFCIFTICSFLGAVFVYFYVPETKEKSLHEIQVMLNS